MVTTLFTNFLAGRVVIMTEVTTASKIFGRAIKKEEVIFMLTESGQLQVIIGVLALATATPVVLKNIFKIKNGLLRWSLMLFIWGLLYFFGKEYCGVF